MEKIASVRLVKANTAYKIAKKADLLKKRNDRSLASLRNKEQKARLYSELNFLQKKILTKAGENQFVLKYFPPLISDLSRKTLVNEICRRLRNAGYGVHLEYDYETTITWGRNHLENNPIEQEQYE